jgi:hypothetical protein
VLLFLGIVVNVVKPVFLYMAEFNCSYSDYQRAHIAMRLCVICNELAGFI